LFKEYVIHNIQKDLSVHLPIEQQGTKVLHKKRLVPTLLESLDFLHKFAYISFSGVDLRFYSCKITGWKRYTCLLHVWVRLVCEYDRWCYFPQWPSPIHECGELRLCVRSR
jgi:hypothetical protein